MMGGGGPAEPLSTRGAGRTYRTFGSAPAPAEGRRVSSRSLAQLLWWPAVLCVGLLAGREAVGGRGASGASGTSGGAISAARTELEEFRPAPAHWVSQGRAAANATVGLSVFVKQRNMARLADELLAIASPASPRYGAHLGRDEVHALVAPGQEQLEEVRGWLRAGGVDVASSATSPNHDILQLQVPVAVAERLLMTQFHVYASSSGGGARTVVRAATGYSVPARVAKHLDFVGPGHRFPSLAKKPREAAPVAAAEEVLADGEGGGGDATGGSGGLGIPRHSFKVSVDGLRKIYNIPPADAAAAAAAASGDAATAAAPPALFSDAWCAGNGGRPTGQAVVSFFDEAADVSGSTSDLGKFAAKYDPALSGVKVGSSGDGATVVRKGGGGDGDGAGAGPIAPGSPRAAGEASLDIQWMLAMSGARTPTAVWRTAGNAPDPITSQTNGKRNENWLGALLRLSRAKCVPAVLSVSYSDNADSVSRPYAQRMNAEFMKLGARGVSVLVATGDSGVGGAWSQPCGAAAPRGSAAHGRFTPSFPAGSPWITAVGGTEGYDAATGAQRGATLSAGGFSNFDRAPAYQASAVRGWLHSPSATRHAGAFDAGGRAYPDLAAQCTSLPTFTRGRNGGADGTSASTPIVAGMISRLNEARRRAGKGPLGFLNPLLYAHPEAFHDATEGSNAGCGTNGFSCGVGWDPVTGLGTPNVAMLEQIVLALPGAAGAAEEPLPEMAPPSSAGVAEE